MDLGDPRQYNGLPATNHTKSIDVEIQPLFVEVMATTPIQIYQNHTKSGRFVGIRGPESTTVGPFVALGTTGTK